MTDCGNFLVADWCPEGEMAGEQWHIDRIFTDLRGGVFRGPNREFVSSRRAFSTRGCILYFRQTANGFASLVINMW